MIGYLKSIRDAVGKFSDKSAGLPESRNCSSCQDQFVKYDWWTVHHALITVISGTDGIELQLNEN